MSTLEEFLAVKDLGTTVAADDPAVLIAALENDGTRGSLRLNATSHELLVSDAAVGAPADAAAGSDGATAGLIGLVKRLLGYLSGSVAGLLGINLRQAGGMALEATSTAAGGIPIYILDPGTGLRAAIASVVASNITQFNGTNANGKTATGFLPVAGPNANSVPIVVPGLSTSAYAAGDCVGTLMTFAGIANANDVTGWLTNALLFSKSAQTAPLDLILFDANPSGTTFTDNTPIALAAADFDKMAGVVHLNDWTNLGTPSFAQDKPNLEFHPASGTTTVYACLVARAAMTLASGTDLTLKLTVSPD